MKMIYPVIGSQTVLPFYLTGIGVCDYEYHAVRENGLVSHQFLFTLSGKGILETDGKTIPQSEGSCFYLASGVPHKYYPVDGEWKTAWFVFRGDGIKETMEKLGFGNYLSKELGNIAPYMQLFEKLYSFAGDNINGGDKCSVVLYELIMKLRKSMCLDISDDDTKQSVVESAVDFIDKNYCIDITLPQLAQLSGVSIQHFCRCFKVKFGMRPVEYIAQRRLAQSKLMLLDTDLTITEIAERVGYSGVTYFGMVFKKYEGISPTEFRKNNGVG